MSQSGTSHAQDDSLRIVPSSLSTTYVVCPCCPLHCDDLTGEELSASPERCSLAYARLHAVLDRDQTAIPADHEQAMLHRCAELIRSSQRTIITGRVLDLATARAVVRLSERIRAELLLTGPNRSSQSVMKRDGSYTCTLGELTRTTNSLLIIGDVEAAWPRISRHLTAVNELAQLEDSPALLDQLAALRLSTTSATTATLPEELDQPTLRQAMELVRSASYMVVLVAPLREDKVQSPLVWSSILGLVQAINRTRRAAILTFDESYTLRSTMASQMEQVPQVNSTIEPSLQIHLSPFGEPSDLETRTAIHIGVAAKNCSTQLWLSAATPGIDAPGIVYRGDGSVALPLLTWQSGTGLPTPADRIKQLLALI